ncbi:Kinesin-1 [Platanthera zijinensis]|uniref:Kinesin-1 n=1 Tax=Platanthera zijinensis TaxID=2320716 RepID=A0AAP0BBG0_9ASPA
MYGPTGAGKSHTMFGCARQAGIVYRALRDILGEGEMNDPEFGLTLFVQVAVLEIYNEEIYDLLSGGNAGGGAATGIALPKAKLEVMGRKAKNATYICGNEAVKISREVAKVEKRRIVKNTLLNERSSRSHCVIIMDVPAVGGRLMLVDMAGSENIEQAGQAGFEAKMQTAKINQGNIALKRVVESIANGDSHVPFRDSKLTMLLQDSFEDDKSKFLMILCASPDPKEMHKTIATLEYGAKAKCIVRVAHMPTPRDKLGIEDSSSLLRSRIVVMNQFIYKLQMENKFKDKEFDKARSELLHKEEEILQLSSKLELMEGRGAAAKEEEFKLRTKLIKMEEKVQQQQKELDFLRKQVEGAESANKESPLHLENRDGGKFMKRLAEMCAGEQGMVKSMELDMGDQQYIHDVKEIEEDKNRAEIQFDGSQPDSYHPNIVEDSEFDVLRFPEKVCLSTVFERDDEGEDRESLEEEVDKEVVDDHQPQNLSNGKESESTRRTRIQNIFRLCGNHRELAQQIKVSTPSKSKPEDADILHSSPSSLGKEIGFKENHSVEFALPTKPGGTSVALLTSVYGLDQESKENKEPRGVESADMMDVYVKWEASKELSGNTIRKLKVLKNSTLCDLRKLIETHLEEANNNQPFTFLLPAVLSSSHYSAFFLNLPLNSKFLFNSSGLPLFK